MNAAMILVERSVVEAAGWSLLHFVWQGALIAAVFAAVSLLLRRKPPNVRYLAGCTALLFLLAAPIVTFFVLANQGRPVEPALAEAEPAPAPDFAEPASPSTGSRDSFDSADFEPNARVPVTTTFSARIRPWFPWLVGGWFAGVILFSGRLVLGWIHVRRLTRRGVELPDPSWQNRFAELQKRLAVSHPVRLLKSGLVDVPSVIGWLRPVILVPAGSLTGLAPPQIEALLAHELAHIRRHDYLVNLFQNAVETLLFYHPAVWWISRRVREEREHCCDDLAVEASREPVAYAEALATLEEWRHFGPQVALRADGSGLLQRVRRILGIPERERIARTRLAGIVALVFVVLVLGGIAVVTAVNREPVYHGKPISSWIAALGSSYGSAAEEVLARAGEEALPYLEKAIVAEEPWFTRTYRASRSALPERVTDLLPEPVRERHFENTRRGATRIIGDVAPDAETAVPLLIRALNDESTRSAAVRNLRDFRRTAAPAVPALIPLLEHPDADLRQSVADTLGWIGPDAGDAVPALVRRLTDSERRVRFFAAQSLGNIAKHPEVAVPALIRAAHAEETELRRTAIQTLGQFGVDAESAVPLIADAVADPDPGIRGRALYALARIGRYPPEIESTLRGIATEPADPREGSVSSVLLWKRYPEDSELTEAVIRYLRWEDDATSATLGSVTIRAAVIRSTTAYNLGHPGQFSSPGSLEPVLRELLEDEIGYVRRNAARALVNLEIEDEATLSHHFDVSISRPRPEPLDPGRRQVIEIFAANDFDRERVDRELLRLLDDRDTVAAAARGLTETGGNLFLKMRPLLSDHRAYVRLTVLEALHGAGHRISERYAVLADLVRDPDESIRVGAARLLSQDTKYYSESDHQVRGFSTADLHGALREASDDSNEEVQRFASRALDDLEANLPDSVP